MRVLPGDPVDIILGIERAGDPPHACAPPSSRPAVVVHVTATGSTRAWRRPRHFDPLRPSGGASHREPLPVTLPLALMAAVAWWWWRCRSASSGHASPRAGDYVAMILSRSASPCPLLAWACCSSSSLRAPGMDKSGASTAGSEGVGPGCARCCCPRSRSAPSRPPCSCAPRAPPF